MSQILHILDKDIRRLWIEIAVSLIALAITTWTEWVLVTPARHPDWYNQAAPLLTLFLCWAVLAARLVQEEALVGDRQFWITRPYIWHNLLAAKVLFVIIWIGLPLSLSQVILLLADHASVMKGLSSILLGTSVTLLVGVLPFVALAVITRTFAQWLVATVTGVLIFAAATILADSHIRESHVITGSDISDTAQAFAFTCLAATGILFNMRVETGSWLPLPLRQPSCLCQ